MDQAEHCGEFLLDYLYDLLDEAESDRVRSHLEQCAECRMRLAQAGAQQRLIARAARLYQQVPAFLPPAPTPAQPSTSAETLSLAHETVVERPVLAPMPAKPAPRHSARWFGVLSLAASVLIAAIIGWGIYQHNLSEFEVAAESARQGVNLIDAHFDKVAEQYPKELAGLPKKLLQQELHLQVAGSTVYRPDAANPVYVQAADLTGKKVPADVTLRVVDSESGKVIFTDKASDITGDVVLDLPAGLTAKPATKWRLEIEAASVRGGDTLVQDMIVAPPSYITQVATSKPAYEIGELLFFRTLTLHQFTHKPAKQPFQLSYALVNSSGQVVKQLIGESKAGGLGGGEFALTPDLGEGAYTLRVEDVSPPASQAYAFTPQSFPVLIHRPDTPKVALEKNLYPGTPAKFAFWGGMKSANQPVTVTVCSKNNSHHEKGEKGKGDNATKDSKHDDKKLAEDRPEQFRTDGLGNANGTIVVPKDLKGKAEAELEVQVYDGKENEKFTQKIPLSSPKWEIAFFPEGGQLVAGLPNRVYCQVSTPGIKSSGLSGQVRNGAGQVVAKVALSPRQSKGPSAQLSGHFTLAPKSGESYTMEVQPASEAVTTQQLPATVASGVTLTVANPVATENTPLRLAVHATEAKLPVLVVAVCQGQVVGQKLALAQSAGTEIELPTSPGTQGVVRVTVYRPQPAGLVPLAERLLYRVPTMKLSLGFTPPTKPAAGEKLGLKVSAQTETGELARCNLLALVVQENAAHGTETPGQFNLPAFFYLTSQVQQPEDLDNASILVGSDAAAHDALDRFLAIQGWRGFTKGSHKLGKGADLPVSSAESPTPANNLFCRDNLEAAQARYDNALVVQLADTEHKFADKRNHLQDQKAAALAHYRTTLADLNQFQSQVRQYLGLGAAAALLIMLALGVVCFAAGLCRIVRSRMPAHRSFAAAFGCLAVCLLLMLATGALRPEPTAGVTLPAAAAKLADLPEPALPKVVAQAEGWDFNVNPPKELPEVLDALLSKQQGARSDHEYEEAPKKSDPGVSGATGKDNFDKDGGKIKGGDKGDDAKGGTGKGTNPKGGDGKTAESKNTPTYSSYAQTYAFNSAFLLKKTNDEAQHKESNQQMGLPLLMNERYMKAAMAQAGSGGGGYGGSWPGKFGGPGGGGYGPPVEPANQPGPGPGGFPTPTPPDTSLPVPPQPSVPPPISGQPGYPPTKTPPPPVPVSPSPTPADKSAEKLPTTDGLFGETSNYARVYFYKQTQQEWLPPDTLLWHPDLLVEKGNAVLNLDLPSYPATYRVFLIGHDAFGRLGYYQGTFVVPAE